MQDTYLLQGMRHRLVLALQKKGIKDAAVLRAIGSVPRHCFFDSALSAHAYEDKAFPIGVGQTISQPYTVAFQTALLGLKPKDKVLEIGTGSGYQACVLLELGAEVYTIEYMLLLYDRVRALLPTLGYGPRFFHADGGLGLGAFAPYDAILATCACPAIPPTWVAQLKVGGRIVAPVGNPTQQMVRCTKQPNGQCTVETFQTFSFVPLQGKYR